MPDLKNIGGLFDPDDPNDIPRRVQRGLPRGEGPFIPPFKPTPEQQHIVMVLAANSSTRAVIADALRIGLKTLDKYFKKEIKAGKDQIKARIGISVVREAIAGNMSAARYWLDRHGGPEWQLPKNVADSQMAYASAADENADEVVHFFLPPNGRDQPDPEPETPVIDGEAEEQAA